MTAFQKNLFTLRDIIGIFILLFIAMVVAGYFFFLKQKDSALLDADVELTAVANLHLNLITQWRNERIGDARSLTENQHALEHVPELLRTKQDAKIGRDFRQWLSVLKNAYRYDDIAFVDSSASMLLNTSERKFPISAMDSAAIRMAVRNREIIFSDFNIDEGQVEFDLDVAAPFITNIDSKPIVKCVVLFRIDPRVHLFPLLEKYPSNSKTGESFLAQRIGDSVQFISGLRFLEPEQRPFRLPLSMKRLTASMFLRGNYRSVEGIDYRGEDVYAIGLKIPGTSWLLVVKKDKAEILEEIKERMIFFALICTSFILLAGVAIGFFWKRTEVTHFKTALLALEEKHHAEEKLRHSESRYRTLIERASDPIFISSADGSYIEVNAAASRLTGYSVDELLRMRITDIIAPEDLNIQPLRLAEVKEKGHISIQRLIRKKDASIIPIDVSATAMEDGTLLAIARDITERIRLMHAIETSEKKYREFVQNSQDVIWSFDLHGNVTFINDAVEQMLGYTADEMIGASYAMIMPTEEFRRLVILFTRTIRNNEPIRDFDTILLHKDGSTVFGISNGAAVRDEYGNVIGVSGTTKDVTQRRAADRELIESERRFRDTLENIRMVAIRLDVQGNIAFCNDYLLELTGWKEDEILHRNWFDLFLPEENKSSVRAIFESNITRRDSFPHYRSAIKTRGDARRLISWNNILLRDITGKVTGMASIGEDITEQAEAQEKLRQSKHLLESIVEGITDAVFVKDTEGRYLVINSHGAELIGKTKEDFIGKTDAEIFSPEEARTIMQEDQQIIRSGSTRVFEESIRNPKTSAVQIFHALKGVLKDEKGNVYGIFGIARDTTEQKQTEDYLRNAKEQAEKAQQLKDSFIANMSHEIRTPLNIIMGYSGLIEASFESQANDEQKNFFQSIQNGGARLMRTVEQILSFSSFETGLFLPRSEIVSVQSIIEKIVREMLPIAEEKKLFLELRVDATDSEILGDHYACDQAFANLIDNAIKFTAKGGVRITLSSNLASTVIEIADTGIGIAKDYLPKLFDAFSQETMGYSRPFEGLGLGLALTKRYIETNHGMLDVWSEKNLGTRFTITFPLAHGTGSPAQRTVEPVKLPLEGKPTVAASKKKSILLVEDDEQTQEYMHIMLIKDFDVLIATNADDALSILRTSHVHLILMDLSLHGQIDGLQLTKIIRDDESLQSIPIFATTAHAFPNDKKKSLEAGCNEYFAKPIQIKQLLQVIGNYL